MADQRDKGDALLDKLDTLIQSGRAQPRREPPPLLTDTVPEVSESAIPTLTDAVETIDENTQQPAPDTTPEPTAPANPQALVSSRLLAALDREMADLAQELPAHDARLSVLHRSIRFALPELVKIRWQETTDQEGDDGSAGASSPGA